MANDVTEYPKYQEGTLYSSLNNLANEMQGLLDTEVSEGDKSKKLINYLISIIKAVDVIFQKYSGGSDPSFTSLISSLIKINSAEKSFKGTYTYNATTKEISFKKEFYLSPLVLDAFEKINAFFKENPDLNQALNFINLNNVNIAYRLTYSGRDLIFKYNDVDINLQQLVTEFNELYSSFMSFYNQEVRLICTDLSSLPNYEDNFKSKIALYNFVKKLKQNHGSVDSMTSAQERALVKDRLQEMQKQIVFLPSEDSDSNLLAIKANISAYLKYLPDTQSVISDIKRLIKDEILRMRAIIASNGGLDLQEIEEYIQMLNAVDPASFIPEINSLRSLDQLGHNEEAYNNAVQDLRDIQVFLQSRPSQTDSSGSLSRLRRLSSSIASMANNTGYERKSDETSQSAENALVGTDTTNVKPRSRWSRVASTLGLRKDDSNRSDEGVAHVRDTVTSDEKSEGFFSSVVRRMPAVSKTSTTPPKSQPALQHDDSNSTINSESSSSHNSSASSSEGTIRSDIERDVTGLLEHLKQRLKFLDDTDKTLRELNENYQAVQDVKPINDYIGEILDNSIVQEYLGSKLDGTACKQRLRGLATNYSEHITQIYISLLDKYFANHDKNNLEVIKEIINYIPDLNYPFLKEFKLKLQKRFAFVEVENLLKADADSGIKLDKYVTLKTNSEDPNYCDVDFATKQPSNLQCLSALNVLRARWLDKERAPSSTSDSAIILESIISSLEDDNKVSLKKQVEIIKQELKKIREYMAISDLEKNLTRYLDELIKGKVVYNDFKAKFAAELHTIDYAAAKQDKKVLERSVWTILAAVSVIGWLVMGASYTATYVTTGRAYLFWETTHKQDAQKALEIASEEVARKFVPVC